MTHWENLEWPSDEENEEDDDLDPDDDLPSFDAEDFELDED